MRQGSANRGFPAGNPLANLLVIIVGALAIGASVVLGFFAFVLLGSIVLILAAIIGIRVWWFNRKLQQAARRNPSRSKAGAGTSPSRETGGVIEGEFVIIEKDDDKS